MKAEIRRAALDRGVTNLIETMAEICGRANATICQRLNGKTQWQAEEIRAVRDAWGLSAEEVNKMFIDT